MPPCSIEPSPARWTGERREALIELAEIEEEHAAHWIDKLTEYGVPVPPAPTELDPQRRSPAGAGPAGPASPTCCGRWRRPRVPTPGCTTPSPRRRPRCPTTSASTSRCSSRCAPRSRARPADAARRVGPARRPGRAKASPGIGPTSPGRCAQRSSESATAWSRTPRSSWASPARRRATAPCCSPAWPACSPASFSMAAGEYVSVASQRDLFRREIEIEATELREKPEEEQKELELIYRAKGLDRQTAAATAAQIMSDPEDRARHPRPRGARPGSRRARLARAGGHLQLRGVRHRRVGRRDPVPVLPGTGRLHRPSRSRWPCCSPSSRWSSSAASSGGCPVVASLFSAGRQLLWGSGAALVTYVVGRLIGITVG